MFRPIVTIVALLAFVASQLVAVAAHAHCAVTHGEHGPEARPHIHWSPSGHAHPHPHAHRHLGEQPRGEHGHSEQRGGQAAQAAADSQATGSSPRCSLCTPHDEDVLYLVGEVSAAVRCGTEETRPSAAEALALAPALRDELPLAGDWAERPWAVPRVDSSDGKLFLKLRQLRI